MNPWFIAFYNTFTTPDFYKSALEMSAPLMLASIGGLFSEKTGVTNIALEGIMLMGAFSAVVGSYFFNPYVGVLIAIAVGMAIASLHAWVSIKYAANQIVSATAVILLSYGITGFLLQKIFGHPGNSPVVDRIPKLVIPGVINIPFIGVIFGQLSPFVWAAFASVIVAWFVIYKTKLGLRMRVVGENPEAADSLGVNVYRIRYFGVIMSGFFAALGGAYLSMNLGQFTEKMTNGRGFIALAAMIFGNWKPKGIFYATLLFGFAEALNMQLQSQSVLQLPSSVQNLFGIIPYLVTLIAVAGLVGKSRPPAADGIPYIKEH